MSNPYQPPPSTSREEAGDYGLIKRILAVPLAGISLIAGLLCVLTALNFALRVFQGVELLNAFSALTGLAIWAAISAGAGALARAFWFPERFSRAALDQAELRAIYAKEKLGELPQGDPGVYRETADGELGRLYERVRPNRLPERHRELMARIKQRVEQLRQQQAPSADR